MALTPQELDALRKITSPTVANAIETFGVRPRHEGFMSPAIRALFPELGSKQLTPGRPPPRRRA